VSPEEEGPLKQALADESADEAADAAADAKAAKAAKAGAAAAKEAVKSATAEQAGKAAMAKATDVKLSDLVTHEDPKQTHAEAAGEGRVKQSATSDDVVIPVDVLPDESGNATAAKAAGGAMAAVVSTNPAAKACGAGEFWDEAGKACGKCAPGTYSSEGGLEACVTCPVHHSCDYEVRGGQRGGRGCDAGWEVEYYGCDNVCGNVCDNVCDNVFDYECECER